MTDTTTTEPEHPFDPNVVARLQARIDKRDLWDVEADVREVLRQLAYFHQEFSAMAAASANWRHKYEQTRAKLEAVRAVANEWATYAYGATQDHPDAALAAGRALGELVNALDGDTDATQDGDPR